MTSITIDDAILESLQTIAVQEQRSVDDVLRSLLALYATTHDDTRLRQEALLAMDAMFDDDVTDLSTTVRETMQEYYRQRYANSD